MALDLRPLTLPELLDRAFGLYRRHLWLFIGIMAVPTTFAVALNVVLETSKRMAGLNTLQAGGAAPDPGQVATLVAAMAIGLGVILVAYGVVYTFALGATTLAVSEIYLGRTATTRQVYRDIRRSAWRLVRLLLLMGLKVGGVAMAVLLVFSIAGGVAAAITGGPGAPVVAGLFVFAGMAVALVLIVYMTIRWGVAVPAAVLEELGARASIARSIELTSGRRWRVLLLIACATVITYAVMALFQGPFLIGAAMVGMETSTGFMLTLAGSVLGAIATTFTAPIMIIGLALLYYDARIRDEGLDLQLMMAAMDEKPLAAEPAHG